MKRGAIIVAVAIASPSHVLASEGLMYALLYQYNAIEINTTITNSCAAAHPEMARSLASAHESWTKHYGERAAVSAAALEKQLREKTLAAHEEWETSRRQLDALESDFIAKLRAEAVASATFCEKAASQLAMYPNEFEEKLWKQR